MLKQIRYFQAVIRTGSFTQAAEECYISQSAVSQQIQALEKELGVQLLTRGNRSFSLTPAGEYFYQKSLVLTADLDRLIKETVRISSGDQAELRVGYLKNYGGHELQLAVAAFSEKYPEVDIRTLSGSHEDLFDFLRHEEVDLALSDQRRAFSDEYVNLILQNTPCTVELPSRNPMSQLPKIRPEDLKNTPCILVSSEARRESEIAFYRDILGFSSEYLLAENIEEARLMVVGGRGFFPAEGGEVPVPFESTIRRVPLYKGETPMTRNYCAFWKIANSGCYVEAFAEMLKGQFAGA